MRRIIIIDDDPLSAQLQPENLIKIKPYTNPRDKGDRSLSNLLPVLVEIARHNYDVPELLSQFEGMDADEIAEEYKRRLDAKRDERIAARERGLGGRLGSMQMDARSMGERRVDPTDLEAVESKSSKAGLTAKDLVGDVSMTGETGAAKESGGLVGWYKERQAAKEEDHARKMEKWQEIMQKKAEEKAAKAKAA